MCPCVCGESDRYFLCQLSIAAASCAVVERINGTETNQAYSIPRRVKCKTPFEQESRTFSHACQVCCSPVVVGMFMNPKNTGDWLYADAGFSLRMPLFTRSSGSGRCLSAFSRLSAFMLRSSSIWWAWRAGAALESGRMWPSRSILSATSLSSCCRIIVTRDAAP